MVDTSARPLAAEIAQASADDRAELDLSPDTWKVVALNDVLSPRNNAVDPSAVDDLRYVGLEHVDSGDIRIRRWGSPRQVRSAKNRFYPGDILYGKLRPYLDKVALAEWDGISSTDILIFNPKAMAAPAFLAYALHLDRFIRFAISTTTGVNHPRTSWSSIKAFPLALPPLPEQRAIAHVLRTIQQAREATEKVIAAARQSKKSLMRHLFTYGPVPVDQVDQVRLKETEIGQVPEHWQVVKLGQVCEKPQYGYTATASSIPVGPKFLRITDIQDERVKWDAVPYCALQAEEFGSYRLTPGDIVVARIGATTGKSYQVKDCPTAVFASYLIRIRTKSLVNPDFLGAWMKTDSYWQQINLSKGGRLKLGINAPVLKALQMPLPPFEEQVEIARLFEWADRKVQIEETGKQALESTFRTLLRHLMTGKMRMQIITSPDSAGVM